jgi:hypothetical protein
MWHNRCLLHKADGDCDMSQLRYLYRGATYPDQGTTGRSLRPAEYACHPRKQTDAENTSATVLSYWIVGWRRPSFATAGTHATTIGGL